MITRRGLFGTLAGCLAWMGVKPAAASPVRAGLTIEQVVQHFGERMRKRPGEYLHSCYIGHENKRFGSLIYAPPGVNVEERERERRLQYEKRRAQWDNDNQAKRGSA